MGELDLAALVAGRARKISVKRPCLDVDSPASSSPSSLKKRIGRVGIGDPKHGWRKRMHAYLGGVRSGFVTVRRGGEHAQRLARGFARSVPWDRLHSACFQ